MEEPKTAPTLRNKILKVVLFVVLVIVFSAAGIYIRNTYGPTYGFGFTLVFVPVILKLAVSKVRTMYAGKFKL